MCCQHTFLTQLLGSTSGNLMGLVHDYPEGRFSIVQGFFCVKSAICNCGIVEGHVISIESIGLRYSLYQ